MRTTAYTPLTEMDPARCNLAGMIPEYAQPEKIGLGVDRIGRIAAWGGFHKDQITIEAHSGETTSHSAAVVGSDMFGNAFMGATTTETVPIGTGTPGTKNADWRTRTNLHLRVNTSELMQRVQESGTTRDPANWAKHIDQALVQGLREAARKNLVSKPFPKTETWLATRGIGGVVLLNAAISQGNPELWTLAAEVVAYELLTPNAGRFATAMANPLTKRDACFSVVPVVHYDRIAAVSLLSRTSKLARAIK